MKMHFNVYQCNDCDKIFLLECKDGIYKEVRCPACFFNNVEEIKGIKEINL